MMEPGVSLKECSVNRFLRACQNADFMLKAHGYSCRISQKYLNVKCLGFSLCYAPVEMTQTKHFDAPSVRISQ